MATANDGIRGPSATERGHDPGRGIDALVVAFATSHPHAGIEFALLVPMVGLLLPVIAFFLPILVVDLAGPRQGAYFYIPWTISIGLRFIAQNMAISMTVETAFDETKRREHLRKVLTGTFRLLLPAVVVVLLAGPYVLELFGHRYAVAGTATLRLLASATIPHAVSMLGLGLARVRHHGRFVGAVQVTDAVVTLAVSAALIPSIGIAGAGIGWLAAQSVAAALTGMWSAYRGPTAPATTG